MEKGWNKKEKDREKLITASPQLDYRNKIIWFLYSPQLFWYFLISIYQFFKTHISLLHKSKNCIHITYYLYQLNLFD